MPRDTIELRHLRTLSALKETGSLVDAADRVHLTQSALSHQIKDLEEKLGCSLFVRKTKPISFTSAGRRLLELANNALPMFRTAERDISRLSEGETGRLHMAIECHSCFQWLMPTIAHYRDHWPEVELDLSSGFNFAPLPALERGDLDLVITSDPVSISGISYIPLFRYEALLAIAKQHPLINKTYIEPIDLADQTLITYPVDKGRLEIFTKFLDPADIEPDNVRTAELTLMMIQLVASGRGVCSLPNWALTEYLQQGYVAARPLTREGQWGTLYAAIREEQSDSAFMVDFLQTAKDESYKHLDGIQTVHDSD